MKESKKQLAAEDNNKTKKRNGISQSPSTNRYNLRHPHVEHEHVEKTNNKKIKVDAPDDGSAMLKLLWTTNVEKLKTDKEILSTTRKSSLLECFKGLAHKQYYSCPVTTQKKQFFNFVDLMDITRFTVSHFAGGKETLADPNNFWEMVQKHHSFASLTVKDLVKWPNTRKNWYGLPIPQTYSLLHVCELMAREKSLHRLAVVDNLESRNLQGIITQSQIVQLIWENIILLGSNKLTKLVGDFPEIFHEVFTINHKAKTLDAFQLMSDKNVTGLPVVDDNDQLVSAISIKDIKGMAADGCLFWRLYQPLHAYLEIIHYEDDLDSVPLVYCTKQDKFSSVLDRLIFHKVHRLPVLQSEKDKKIIGIITLRDVIHMALFTD